MRARLGWLLIVLIPAVARSSDADVATEMAARYNRVTSRVMVRVVPRLTRAELDQAAYESNVML